MKTVKPLMSVALILVRMEDIVKMVTVHTAAIVLLDMLVYTAIPILMNAFPILVRMKEHV